MFNFVSLFQYQSHDQLDTVVLLESTLYGLFVFLILFVTCELGEGVVNIFSEIDNEIVQSNWYLFPRNVQKMLPLVMINAQKPVVIKCFGNVACTRWQFRKVDFN